MNSNIDSLKLPTLDPYLTQTIEAEKEASIITVKTKINNIITKGYSSFVIDQLWFDPNKLTAFMSIRMPKLNIFAPYEASGKLLAVSIPANGNFKTNLGIYFIYFFIFYNFVKK